MNKLNKHIVLFIVLGTVAAYVFADYIPPPGSQNLFRYSHPKFISTARSAAGGPLFSAGSYSGALNPALSAAIRKGAADAGVTVLPQSGDDIGAAVRLGGAYTTRWGVFSAGADGIFSSLPEMPFGNVGVLRLGFARDITDNFYFGLSATGGLSDFEGVSDFYICADVGLWYRIRELAFLKNVRFAAVAQNLGKTFETSGPYVWENVTGFPVFLTLDAGVAASFVETPSFSAGVSCDVSFPAVTNIVLNAGVQVAIKQLVFVSAGWDFNIRETVDYENAVHGPYVALGIRKTFENAKTKFDAEGAWQNLHGNARLFSAGVSAQFGTDASGPDVSIDGVSFN